MGKGKSGGSSIQAPRIPTEPMFLSLYNQQFIPMAAQGQQEQQSMANLASWAANIATGGNVGLPTFGGGASTAPAFTSGGAGVGGTGAALGNLTPQQLAATGYNPLAHVDMQSLGPFLAQAVKGIVQDEYTAGQLRTFMQGLPAQAQNEFAQANALMDTSGAFFNTGSQILGQGTGMINQGSNILGAGGNMLNMATTGTGLFPTQQAMINQAVTAQQDQIAQQFARAGLGASTQLVQLLGQTSVAGAAAAGQLVQQNIAAANQTMGTGITEQQAGIAEQEAGLKAYAVGVSEQGLSQVEQQIAQDTQKIDLQAQGDLFNQFATVSQLSSGIQGNMWTEAMQAQGAFGNMMNNVLNAFGAALRSSEDMQQVQNIQGQLSVNAAQVNAQAQAAQAQGFSSMLGGLGTLLGGQGGLFGTGGTGGALGGLGGLLGSFGSAGSLTFGPGIGAGIVGPITGGALPTAGSGLLGALGGLGSAIGGAGSGILGSLGGLLAGVAAL